MITARVAFLFLVEIGAGSLLVLWLLRRFEISRSWRQLMAGLSGALVAGALPLGAQALGQAPGLGARLLEAPLLWPLLLVTGCAAYVVSLSVWRLDWSAWLLAGSALAGVASVASGALAVGAASGLWADLLLAGYFLSAALLLGSTLGAMILGHWYLVDRKMAIDPLRLASALLLAAVLARIAVVGAPGVRFWLAQSPGEGELPVALDLMVLWAQRALFGLAGALALALMVRRTVQLRATQAATGLLYIALIFVIVGEILSNYLFLRTDRFL